MTGKGKKITYELGYLIKNDLDNKGVLEQLEKVSAQVISSSDPKTMRLAYAIEKQESAQFGHLNFTIEDAEKLSDLTQALNMQDEVLRFIIVKLPTKKEVKRKKVEKPSTEKKAEDFSALSNEKLEEKLEEFVR